MTPVVGYLVGQYLFAPIRERIRAQPGEPGWAGKTVLFLTDPMGVVNVATDRLFGVKAGLSLQLTGLRTSNDRLMVQGEADYVRHGHMPVGPDSVLGWGLQLQATW